MLDIQYGQGVKYKNLMGQDLDPSCGWEYRRLCSIPPPPERGYPLASDKSSLAGSPITRGGPARLRQTRRVYHYTLIYHTFSCHSRSSNNLLLKLAPRKHMACSAVGMVNGRGCDGQQEDAVCDAHRPCRTIVTHLNWFLSSPPPLPHLLQFEQHSPVRLSRDLRHPQLLLQKHHSDNIQFNLLDFKDWRQWITNKTCVLCFHSSCNWSGWPTNN